MDEIREATEALIEEKPTLEAGLRSLLEVDTERQRWEFDDVPLDSGQFGEVVSRGLVEETDDGYRITDRTAVRAGIGDETASKTGTSDVVGRIARLPTAVRSSVLSVDRRIAAWLAVALVLVVAFRLVPYPAVFRGEVVLSSNDPYLYRYWVDLVAERASGPTDLGTLASFPEALATEEPLLVATLWWIAELFGGGRGAVAAVLAWYPVVSAVVTGLLVFALGRQITGDWRVGVAAVSFLAVSPLHAIRTGVGFADHHAFDYPWLVATALALVVLVDADVRARRTWATAAALGVAVAGQILAWDNGALLLVPLGLYVALRTLSDVRAGESPLFGGLPVVGGVAFGAILVGAAHVGLGWQSGVVAAVPVVLFVGVLGVLLVAELHARFGVSHDRLLVSQVLGGLVVVLVVVSVVPSLLDALLTGWNRLLGTEGIVEAAGLLSGHFGLVTAPLVLFGFVILLAVPAMVWLGWQTYREHDPAWLVPTVYAWFFLALTGLQIRFGAEFSLFAAVFAGFGFVKLSTWVDVLEPTPAAGDERRTPTTLESGTRRDALYAAGLWIGVGGLGSILTPVKHGQVTTEWETVQAARRMRTYADERGWEYPDNYVFSNWDRNRAYNYFVNGESQSYAYAQKKYPEFRSATDSEEWFRQLAPRAGFVVTRDDDLADDAPVIEGSLYYALHLGYGVETGHYRAIWASADGSTKAFALVPGARVVGPGDPGSSVTLQTVVSAGETTFDFERSVQVNDQGVFTATLPQPGEYAVGDRTVAVPESAVETGGDVSLFPGDLVGHWSFDEGTGSRAHDRIGNHRGTLTGDAGWTDGVDDSALSLGGNGYVELPLSSSPRFSISLWVRPAGPREFTQHLIISQNGPVLTLKPWDTIGLKLQGVTTKQWTAGDVPPEKWTHVVATYDGAEQTIYVNGERVGSNEVGGGPVDWGNWLRVGAWGTDGDHGFEGAIDDLHVFATAIDGDRVRELFRRG